MKNRFIWVSIVIVLLIAAGYIIFQSFLKPKPHPVVYTEPHAYSITYPSNWQRKVRGTSGREILALYNYDYQNAETAASDSSPREIKIALSIMDKGSLTLEQIVAQKFTGTEKGYHKRILTINGHAAIRIKVALPTDSGSSPMVQTFIDYKDNQYALLIGYYDGSKRSAGEIRKICNSFAVIE